MLRNQIMKLVAACMISESQKKSLLSLAFRRPSAIQPTLMWLKGLLRGWLWPCVGAFCGHTGLTLNFQSQFFWPDSGVTYMCSRLISAWLDICLDMKGSFQISCGSTIQSGSQFQTMCPLNDIIIPQIGEAKAISSSRSRVYMIN